jgi:hypothetical protein
MVRELLRKHAWPACVGHLAPAEAAGGRPRYSLVWKLALLPRRPGQALCLARPEWGPPTSVGSAARVDAVKRQLAAERRGQQQQQQHRPEDPH